MLIINPVNAETAARPFSVAQQDPPTDSDEPPILSDKVDADLTIALDTKGSADFYIDFADHADLAAASSYHRLGGSGAAVVKTLQATADASQAEVRKSWTPSRSSYTSFWIANTILVRSGSIEIAQQAVEQADVEAIRAPETYEIPEPTIGIDEQQINAVEWGIDRINADDVWSTLGVRGEGIVVGSIDTGVNFQHPALAAQYRGNSGGEINHDYNWFDPSNVCCRGIPCDNNNHGTHTMGTMVGGDGGANNIGVAPEHAGSPRKAVNPTPARTERCWSPASGCWRPPGWTGQVPTPHSDRRSSTTPGADREVTVGTARPSRLACRRHLPGVLWRQQRPRLRIGRFAR